MKLQVGPAEQLGRLVPGQGAAETVLGVEERVVRPEQPGSASKMSKEASTHLSAE